jgi:PBP1b-binding outer membrane lipoprotein LpoB
MKSKLMIAIAAMGVAVLFSSCQKAPEAEVAAATAAIQEVKDAGADLYVPEAYQALVDSMKSANEKIEVAKAKWFPNYTKAKELLAYVSTTATDVKAKSEARKVELKAETEAMIGEVKTLIADNTALIAKAPRGKEGREALEAIKADLAVAETTVTEVESLLANGDLIGSNDKIKAAKEKATSIKAELEEAIAKKGAAAPKKAVKK